MRYILLLALTFCSWNSMADDPPTMKLTDEQYRNIQVLAQVYKIDRKTKHMTLLSKTHSYDHARDLVKIKRDLKKKKILLKID